LGGNVKNAIAQDPPRETVLTLAEAVALAKERAPLVHLAFARVASAEAGLDRSAAARLPTFSASGLGTAYVRDGQVYSSGIVSSTSRETYLAGQSSLHAQWPVYDFGRTSSAIDAAKAGVLSVRLTAEATQQDAMVETAVAFFNLLADSELVRTAQEILTQREQVLAITRRQVESGYRMPVDEIRAQVSVDEARLDLSIAEATRESDSVHLSNALLLQPTTMLRLVAPGPLAIREIPLADVPSAIRDRRDVGAANARVEQTRRGLDAARRAHLPLLSFNATGTLLYVHDRASIPGAAPVITDGVTKLATGGISLSVPIFDPVIEANVKAAEGSLREAQANFEQVTLTARSQTSLALTQLRRARAVLYQSQRLAMGAAASLSTIAERYATGIESPLSLADAQRQDVVGRVAVIRAHLAVDVAEVRALATLTRIHELLTAR
jgi:outer membrane protein TolC